MYDIYNYYTQMTIAVIFLAISCLASFTWGRRRNTILEEEAYDRGFRTMGFKLAEQRALKADLESKLKSARVDAVEDGRRQAWEEIRGKLVKFLREEADSLESGYPEDEEK